MFLFGSKNKATLQSKIPQYGNVKGVNATDSGYYDVKK